MPVFSHPKAVTAVKSGLDQPLTSDTIGLCYKSVDVFMNVSNIHDELFAESFVYSSLHVTSVIKVSCLHYKGSVIILMLLLSGDINAAPGPTINHSLTREEFKQNLSARGFKMVHQNICGPYT